MDADVGVSVDVLDADVGAPSSEASGVHVREAAVVAAAAAADGVLLIRPRLLAPHKRRRSDPIASDQPLEYRSRLVQPLAMVYRRCPPPALGPPLQPLLQPLSCWAQHETAAAVVDADLIRSLCRASPY